MTKQFHMQQYTSIEQSRSLLEQGKELPCPAKQQMEQSTPMVYMTDNQWLSFND